MNILPVTRPPVGKAAGKGSRLRGRVPDASPAGGVLKKPGFSASALGTNAKYKFTPQKVDPETGEITGFCPMQTKVQRFILQSVARTLFDNKTSRLNKCLRIRASHKPAWSDVFIPQPIKVWKSTEHKTAHYTGLQTCGSVWVCPVCSAKISERRRSEILHAMDAHKAAEGCVNMLTLTAPHQVKDNLVELLAKQAKALNLFWSDRVVKQILAEMGTIGQIRALEPTHGRKSEKNNGWHPHYHVLMFQGIGVDLVRFDQAQMTDWQVRLYLRWAARCVAAGLGEPSYAHGLKLDNGDQAAKYVTKWGLEDEMTKGHTKKALHGETPFDLLRALLADKGDKQAAALFIEYAKAFKGKRQLHWSKGLKNLYQVKEKTDDALAAETDDNASLLGMLTIDQWRDVLAVEGRGAVLQVAASGGWDALADYLESIKGKGVKP